MILWNRIIYSWEVLPQFSNLVVVIFGVTDLSGKGWKLYFFLGNGYKGYKGKIQSSMSKGLKFMSLGLRTVDHVHVSHFKNQEGESQKGSVICPRSPRQVVRVQLMVKQWRIANFHQDAGPYYSLMKVYAYVYP